MDPVQVIYIEDEDTVATLFRLALAPRGIDVLHIPDSSPETLQEMDTPAYQAARAVFIDQWIGGMNGIELAQQLREKGDTRPFFLLTAGENPNPPLLRELTVTYLRKPIKDYDQLANLLRTY